MKPVTDCIGKINNTQVDDTKDTDVVVSLYNFAEFKDNDSNIAEIKQL